MMDRRWMTLLGGLLMLALVLAACAGPSTPQDEPTEATQIVEMHEEDEHAPDADHDEGEAHEEGEHTEEAEGAHEDEHTEGEEMHEGEHTEGEEHIHLEVPEEYAGLTNPLAGDAEAVAAGRELFMASCATCHGETGLGDGPVAVGLNPPPASFADAAMMADMSDGYIFWRISEGGVGDPFNSAMPAWNFFSEEQIWQLVSFLRALPAEEPY